MKINKIIGSVWLVVLMGACIFMMCCSGDNHAKTPAEKDSLTQRKSNAEVLLEAVETRNEIVKDISKDIKRKDSTRKANRERMFVYQIGLPKNNINELWRSYKALQGVSNIYVFKESGKSFIIFKDDGYTEKKLLDSLNNFKSKIASFENRVEIINLMSSCPGKKTIIAIEDLKIKKEGDVIPCFICK